MQRLKRQFCAANGPIDVFGRCRVKGRLWTTCCFLLLPAFASIAAGQSIVDSMPPALLENFDGPAPLLKPFTSGNGFAVGQRTIDRNNFRHGSGAERIVLQGPAGRTAQLAYVLPPTPVIQELVIRADLVTNRAGVQLAANVVLPRSTNRATGRPFEILVRGKKVGAGGTWEELTLDSLPQKLARQARVARARHGGAIDERGAYVSQVVFLAPGGRGKTELIVDRVRVYGVVNLSQRQQEPASAEQASAQQFPAPRLVSNTAATLAVRDRYARVPRIIQWQGEPFERLRQLGFNAIGMRRLPTVQELQQAERLGLALLCPPPPPQELTDKGITAEWNAVLAWDLGEQLSTDDLTYVERWEKLIARHDPIDARPTVLAPQLHALEASRISDVLLLDRPVVGSEVTMLNHSAWLAQRQRIARPGTPLWTKIETQPSPSQQLQMIALSTHGAPLRQTTYSQLVALTSVSLGVKARGFFFQSESSLAPQDPTTQARALALELTNLRLRLIEPWLVANKELSTARSTQPELTALVMQVERSHLLAPVWWSLDMRTSVHPRLAGPVSFVVPGVAESSEAFLVTMGGMQRVRHRRVTGGIRVSLDELPYDSFLLLTDDPQAISQVTRYLRRIAPRAAKGPARPNELPSGRDQSSTRQPTIYLTTNQPSTGHY